MTVPHPHAAHTKKVGYFLNLVVGGSWNKEEKQVLIAIYGGSATLHFNINSSLIISYLTPNM